MENQSVTPSQDLLDKVKAAKALTTAHSLLGVGMFQFRHQEQLKQSLEFLELLHKQVIEECLQHVDCDLVPELVEYKAQQDEHEKMQEILKAQSITGQE